MMILAPILKKWNQKNRHIIKRKMCFLGLGFWNSHENITI